MKLLTRAGTICLSAMIGASAALADAAVPSLDPAAFGRHPLRLFTAADGLPQSSVEAMAVDLRGYLWVGTRDGAAFWDGRSWTTVRMPQHQLSNWVRCLLVAADGSLWFGTAGGGVHRLVDGVWTTFDTATGLPSNDVRALLETRDPSGSTGLWAGTGSGIARFDEGAWRALTPDGVTGDWQVTTLAETRDGDGTSVIWAGADHQGLWRLRHGRWDRVGRDTGLPERRVHGLWTDPHETGRVWVTLERALFQVESDGDDLGIVDRTAGLPNDTVYALARVVSPDGTNRVCAAIGEGNLTCFENGAWQPLLFTVPLPSRFVYDLEPVTVGKVTRALWIGTQEGLGRLELGSWMAFTPGNGLPAKSVTSLLITQTDERQKALWVGTADGGLARLADGRWTYYNRASGLPDDSVFALLETGGPGARRALWVGTNEGLARIQDGRVGLVVTERDGLPHNAVTALMSTPDPAGGDLLWVGTYGGGLARLGPDGWTVFDRTSGLPDNRIEALLATRSSRGDIDIWVATNAGLAVRRGSIWKVLDHRVGLPNNVIRSLHVSTDRDGVRTLWVGTGGGLAWRDLDDDGATWRVLTEETTPALPSAVIYRIEEDVRSRLYLCTNRGVVRLAPTRSEGTPVDFTMSTFTTEDGLPGLECNFGASTTDFQHRVWMGTTRGAAVFDPSREVEDTTAKPLRLVRVVAGEESIAPGRLEGLRLPYSRNRFVFETALVSMFREAETAYRLQLVGFDPHPTQWGPDGRATYTNLPSGAYTLTAWGRDYAGNVSGPLEVSFSIAPAPWNTWWARLLMGLVALGLVYGGFRVRLRALRQRTRKLEAIVSARTAQLAQKAEEAAASEHTAKQAHARLRDANDKIEQLLKAAPKPAADIGDWCRSQAEQLVASLSLPRLDVWLMDAGRLLPVTDPTSAAPNLRELRRAVQDRSWLPTPSGTLIPLLSTTGALVGALVIESRPGGLDEAERRVVVSFAHQVGAAVELQRTRQRLDDARQRRLAARAQLAERGVELMQLCPQCGTCYGESIAACPRDQAPLSGEHALPLRLAGRYRLERVLGRGGYGIVFAAHDLDLDRGVAVKLLRGATRVPISLGRIDHEAWAATRIQHPGVVAVFDAGVLPDDSQYLVMERLSGADLARTIAAQGRGRFDQVAALVDQGAQALAAAHREGLLHRDIKPSNLYLGTSDRREGFRVKVLDFGIATAFTHDLESTEANRLVGTPAYMSPEQIRRETLDARSDLYSFAAVCYEALTARRTLRADRLADMVMELALTIPPPPSRFRPDVPAAVDDALARALSKSPADRRASIVDWADEMASHLRAAATDAAGGWEVPVIVDSPRFTLGAGTSATTASLRMRRTSVHQRRNAVRMAPDPQIPELFWSNPLGTPEGYYINSVAISADGGVVVAGTYKHTYGERDDAVPPGAGSSDSGTFGTYCFDREGRQLWQDTFEGDEGIYATAVSGDGTIAASGGWFAYGQAVLRVYEVAGDGTALLDFSPTGRTNSLALSNDGTVLVAGADAVYLFQQTNGVFPSSPSSMPLDPGTFGAQSIAITSDGTRFVTADAVESAPGEYTSTVYRLGNNSGQIGDKQTCILPNTYVHAVAMTPDGAWFVVSASDTSTETPTGVLYLFSPTSIGDGTFAAKLELSSLPPVHRVGAARGVAISADGNRIAVVANDLTNVGIVSVIQNLNGTLTTSWTEATPHPPNSTSLDAAGKYVCLANGYPDGAPGQFVLCDAASGRMLWTCPTDNMNWPMVLSANASGIAAGSDNGTLYYFTPAAADVAATHSSSSSSSATDTSTG